MYVGDSAGNTIGGSTAAAGNLISGNTTVGVLIGSSSADSATSNNLVEGNLIGTDATGVNALPNLTVGIQSFGTGTTIGGAAAGAGNVVSANPQGNVLVLGNDGLVAGNFLGLDITGTTTWARPGITSSSSRWAARSAAPRRRRGTSSRRPRRTRSTSSTGPAAT